MKTPVANERYLQALKNLELARQDESLADDDHVELAIIKTNTALMELNSVIRDIKNGLIV